MNNVIRQISEFQQSDYGKASNSWFLVYVNHKYANSIIDIRRALSRILSPRNESFMSVSIVLAIFQLHMSFVPPSLW